MNHSFIPSLSNALLCAKCKKDKIAHTDKATCEACNQQGNVELIYGNMLMCQSCIDAEKKAYAESMTPETIQKRVDDGNSIDNINMTIAKNMNDAIQVRTDLFNAATQSILELKQQIDSDDSIQNKPYTLASALRDRFEHFQKVIFEMQQTIGEAANNQKAIQVYLNQLANQLRAEEREKLKIADINYKPAAPKPVKAVTTPKKKYTKEDIRKVASQLTTELGQPVPEFMVQQYVVMGNCTPEEAGNKIRKFVMEGRSETT